MGNIIWRKISTTNTTGGGCWMGSIYFPRDGHITYEHEYVILFRKQGKAPGPPSPEAKEASRLTKEQRSAWFRGVWDDIFPTRQEAHRGDVPGGAAATADPDVQLLGETVLDPFLGSGSTALAAAQVGRNSVGYEINPAFEDMIRSRFAPPPSDFHPQVTHRSQETL